VLTNTNSVTDIVFDTSRRRKETERYARYVLCRERRSTLQRGEEYNTSIKSEPFRDEERARGGQGHRRFITGTDRSCQEPGGLRKASKAGCKTRQRGRTQTFVYLTLSFCGAKWGIRNLGGQDRVGSLGTFAMVRGTNPEGST